MSVTPRHVITDAPWLKWTRLTIGCGMAVHNELGPGHREVTYHNAMEIKFQQSGALEFEREPYIPVTLADGSVARGNCPDFVVARLVIVELKAHFHTMSKDDEAQIIGYFAALPECRVAIYLNFGRPRLEYHRLLPPTTVQAYQREKWGR